MHGSSSDVRYSLTLRPLYLTGKIYDYDRTTNGDLYILVLTSTTTNTRFSNSETVGARETASFWREKRDSCRNLRVHSFGAILAILIPV